MVGDSVYGSTPSITLGTWMPWKCSDVLSGSSFLSTMRTLSPELTWISGAGTTPLYVQALTILPGSTSQSTTFDVITNSLVPSSRMVGSIIWPPLPTVVAGYCWATFSISASICDHVISALPPVVMPSVPEAPPALSLTTRVPTMPAPS